MKRRFADRPNWSRILDKTYKCIQIDDGSFHGHVAYLSLNQVREPLWVTYGANRICIVDDGYVWLQLFPSGGHAALTAVYDRTRQFVQGYFDIVKTIGVTDDGIPYFDDLYLDVVKIPSGQVYILDKDELEAAYEASEITKYDFNFAKNAALSVVASIMEQRNNLLNLADPFLEMMEQWTSVMYKPPKIRLYQSADYTAVHRLHVEGLEQFHARAEQVTLDDDMANIEQHYLRNQGTFIVLLVDDEIIGMGAFRNKGNGLAEIKRIRVDRKVQQKGYGQLILSYLETSAKIKGYRKTTLDTTEAQLPAQKLFIKNGYEETHRKAFGEIKVIFYKKTLTK